MIVLLLYYEEQLKIILKDNLKTPSFGKKMASELETWNIYLLIPRKKRASIHGS